MDTLWQDLRFALRSFRKSSGFTAAAVLTLGLGIGANSALFSVLNGVLLEPLPYPEPDRLVRVFEESQTYPRFPISPANFLDHRQAAGEGDRPIGELAIYVRSDVELTAAERSERLPGMEVSAGFFRLLGREPVLGRDFTAADELPGRPAIAILSDRLWQRRFDRAGDVLGKPLTLDGVPHTIVGVLPPGLQHVGGSYRSLPHGTVVDVWRPKTLDPANVRRWAHYLNAVGRLAPGVTLEAAAARLSLTAERLADEYPDSNDGWSISVVPLAEDIVGGTRPMLAVLLGAVVLVLLVACVNVANLLLARSTARRQEIAMRRALGAGRWRLVRQVLTESLALAGMGGVLGLGLSVAGVRLVRLLGPERLPRLHEVAIDLRVLGFTVAVALLTGLVFGLVPALQISRTSLRATLGAAAGTGRRSRLRRVLVVAELALAIVLLAGAALLLQTFRNLRRVDPGFEPQRVLAATVALPEARYPEDADVAAFFPRLVDRIAALPGVVSAGAGSDLPWTGYDENMSFTTEGRLGNREAKIRNRFHLVTAGYFRSLGVPLLAGREIEHRDDAEAPRRVIVNRRLVEVAFPGEEAVGRRITWSGEPEDDDWFTIVGVVGDVKDSPAAESLLPAVFFPHAQQTWRRELQLVVRTAADPVAVAALVRRELKALDSDLPLARLTTLAEVADASYSEPRFLSGLVGGFAATALMLAVVGLYGVLSYSVSRRRREMAVRVALGAGTGDVVRLVLVQGMTLIAAGVGLGVAGALALSRVLQGLLYGVSPNDPAILGVVVAVLVMVALVANYLPARRAARVDPNAALRYE